MSAKIGTLALPAMSMTVATTILITTNSPPPQAATTPCILAIFGHGRQAKCSTSPRDSSPSTCFISSRFLKPGSSSSDAAALPSRVDPSPFSSSSSSSRGFDFFLPRDSSSSDSVFAWYFFLGGGAIVPSHSGHVSSSPSSDCLVCPQSEHLMVIAMG